MAMTRNLLVELFVEELPPKALRRLGDSFAALISQGLRERGLIADGAVATPYATPRRLAVHITQVAAQAAQRSLRQKLMPATVGLDAAGNPTPALLKKLASLGADASAVPQLQRVAEGKSETLYFDSTMPGASLAEGLQQALDEMLAKLPIPKVMSYQLADGWHGVRFVRPAHGLVALHGSEVVPVSLLGLAAGRTTQGHRFEARQPRIDVRDADSYAQQLQEEGAVIAGFDARRDEIARQIAAAATREGATPVDDPALLDEVTALVERPNVLACGFEPEFLAVPQACLILTMKANRKYFPLLDAAGKLTHRFLVVSNIRPADASAVIQGNERVVRPRLADAKFFFDQDKKRTLASRVPGLDKVVYHGKLGSQGERSQRVAAIARAIVNALRMATVPYTVEAKEGFDVLDAKVREAAQLAKADLLTDMVGEFPELQGQMGGIYARHEGLRDGVAIAIEDHYKPRFAGDELPRNHTGTVLALADKLETLVGLFGIGQLPSGDKDPFALRRHALGVVRMLVERALPLELQSLLDDAARPFGALLPDAAASNAQLLAFIHERVGGYLREQGHGAAEVEAVLAARPPWAELPRSLQAVREFAALPEAPALAAANKRIANILKKSDAGAAAASVDTALLREPAEAALHAALAAVRPQADALVEQGNPTASLRTLAALKAPVDAFFDQVMVNADDAALRANRLALLGALHAAMNRVADLSLLAR